MISQVIDKLDQLYPITNKPLGYVVKKEINDLFYPCKLVNNEYKQVLDFQKLSDFHYWYLTGDVISEEITNRYGVKRIFQLNMPIRVFICKKDTCDENLALSFYMNIDKLSMQVRAQLEILNFDIKVNSFNLIRDTILESEFNDQIKLMDKYHVATIDTIMSIQIDKQCLDNLC